MRIKGIDCKVDVVLSVYYQPPNQDSGIDELFHRQVREIPGLVALVLLEDFNFPDINCEYHTATASKAGKFLRQLPITSTE